MEHNEQSYSVELYELEPGQVIDISDQAFEDLRASLQKIEAMKQSVAEGILKAKKKNLNEHVEKFRAILRELVIMENSLLEEQSKKETAKLASELDQLEAECTKELSAVAEESAVQESKSTHTLKATRFGIAAKLIGFGGVFACLLGCIAYLSLVQIDAVPVSFDWIWLIVNAVLVVIFAAIGLALNKKALYYLALAQEDADQLAAEEAQAAQKLAAQFSNLALQAYAVELELENREKQSDVEEPIKEKGPFFSIKKISHGKTEGVQVSVNTSPVLIAAAAVAGASAAVLAAFLLGKRSGGEKKAKNPASRSENNAPKLQGILFRVED